MGVEGGWEIEVGGIVNGNRRFALRHIIKNIKQIKKG